MNQAAFAQHVGVTQSRVSKWENDRDPESPGPENLRRLARAAKKTVDEFLEMQEHVMRVPIIGFIGVGATMTFYQGNREDFETIEAPKGATAATVAAEVQDDSLGIGCIGWHAFYDEVKSSPDDEMIGRMCVVGLADGRILVRRLEIGQISGKYNLFAIIGPPMYDVSVVWASKVRHLSQN